MLKEEKQALLSYCYHLQVTLQKGSLYDYRASSSHYRIIGSVSDLVISPILERSYVPKTQQVR